jgi:hypothetical protein
MKIAAYFFAALNFFLWCAWAWLGLSILQGIREQHAAGYPTVSQVTCLEVLPFFVLAAICLSAFLLRRKTEAFLGVQCLLSVITVIGGSLYLGQFSGGV